MKWLALSKENVSTTEEPETIKSTISSEGQSSDSLFSIFGREITKELASSIQNDECLKLKKAVESSEHIKVQTILDKDIFFPNFSPSVESIRQGKETDFDTFYYDNVDTFRKTNRWRTDDEKLDQFRLQMNEKHFVINGNIQNEYNKDNTKHLPIWLRVYRRVMPLRTVLEKLCKVKDIEKTVVYVTIDGDKFVGIVEELLKVKCVKMKVYFHSLKHDLKQLLGNEYKEEYLAKTTAKLTEHCIYGLYMLYYLYNYPYVITLEDDIAPLPDFYNYHLSIYSKTLQEETSYYAVASHAHGINHNCNFIKGSLLDLPNNSCRVRDVYQLILEPYFAVWGSGIPKKIFKRLWQVWIDLSVKGDKGYLGTILTGLRKPNERTISPCSNRITRIPNVGVNGEDLSIRYWNYVEQAASFFQTLELVRPQERKYKIIE
ncbi:hypothetical protein ABK040_010317 [Willaertia magna]